jgi:hypothetical protein
MRQELGQQRLAGGGSQHAEEKQAWQALVVAALRLIIVAVFVKTTRDRCRFSRRRLAVLVDVFFFDDLGASFVARIDPASSQEPDVAITNIRPPFRYVTHTQSTVPVVSFPRD